MRAIHHLRRHSELALFATAYLLYTAGRWVTAAELAPSTAHAESIMRFERDLGIAVERSAQQALDHGVAMWLLSHIYLAAQLAVVPASLIWLYRCRRPIYRTLRNTVLTTWMLAIPIYALYPVAPPRLAGIGMADTVSQQAAVALTGHSTMFYNPYAAVPSLHCGFAFAVGIAAATAVRSPWVKVMALLWGPLVSLSVVATGNHYVFDIAAGLVVSVAGYLVGRLLSRRSDVRIARERPRTRAILDGSRA